MTKTQQGFTIIELLISTTIFSVILLVVSAAMISMGRVYYRGITSSKTQEASRAIIEDVSQAVQFNGGTVNIPATIPAASNWLCVGNREYDYYLGKQVVDSGTPTHAFVTSDCTGTPLDLSSVTLVLDTTKEHELIPVKMRLSRLTVKPVAGSPNLYSITVRVVSGDDDLLADKLDSITGAAGNDGILDSCNSQAGSQYCAVSELTTVVQKRVQ